MRLALLLPGVALAQIFPNVEYTWPACGSANYDLARGDQNVCGGTGPCSMGYQSACNAAMILPTSGTYVVMVGIGAAMCTGTPDSKLVWRSGLCAFDEMYTCNGTHVVKSDCNRNELGSWTYGLCDVVTKTGYSCQDFTTKAPSEQTSQTKSPTSRPTPDQTTPTAGQTKSPTSRPTPDQTTPTTSRPTPDQTTPTMGQTKSPQTAPTDQTKPPTPRPNPDTPTEQTRSPTARPTPDQTTPTMGQTKSPQTAPTDQTKPPTPRPNPDTPTEQTKSPTRDTAPTDQTKPPTPRPNPDTPTEQTRSPTKGSPTDQTKPPTDQTKPPSTQQTRSPSIATKPPTEGEVSASMVVGPSLLFAGWFLM